MIFNHEVEHGNVEYKRKIGNDPKRFNQLISQLIWRLDEGNGIAIYMLGLNDNGTPYSMINEEYQMSLLSLYKMCSHVNARIINITVLRLQNIPIYEITIIKNTKFIMEIRVLLFGENCMLYLTQIKHENEKLLPSMYNHEHEINNGISSLIIEHIGYDKNAVLQNYKNCSSISEIKNNSSIIVVFFVVPNMKICENILNYMDAIMFCGSSQFTDTNNDILLNKIISNKIHKLNSMEYFNPYDIPIKRKYNQSGILLLTILSQNNNKWLLTFLNIGLEIKINNSFYSFSNINTCVPIITILEMRYFDIHVIKIKDNITFSAIVKCECDLKKYKRMLFLKI